MKKLVFALTLLTALSATAQRGIYQSVVAKDSLQLHNVWYKFFVDAVYISDDSLRVRKDGTLYSYALPTGGGGGGSSTLAGLTDITLTSIANGQLLKYNSGTGKWINFTPSFLTSYTETDPIYLASSWYGTTNNSGNWNTSYSWGDHAGLYPLLSGSYSNPSWIETVAK